MKVQEDGSYDCRCRFNYGQLSSGVIAQYTSNPSDAGSGKVLVLSKALVGGHVMLGYCRVMIGIMWKIDFVPLAARIISTPEKLFILVQKDSIFTTQTTVSGIIT